ncbi:MAG: hypothetical protein P4L74_07020 [Candidatus Doudnabacteria bacterium]|nr:hypothetical protein [Candidatus Doudnabacteria bacterium]
MTDEQKIQSMKDGVLKAIEDGQVKMRPKWLFATRTAMMVLGVVLIALTVLYLVSFIVFILRQTGVLFVPAFGPQDFGIFFASLPWLLIALASIFMLLLEILIKRYAFAYGRPFLYSALGVIFLGIIGGIVIGETPLHERFFDEAENGQLPFAGMMYQHYGRQPSNVTVGVITQIDNNGYRVECGSNDEMFSVVVGPQTQIPPAESLKVGDTILILGPRQGNIIVAQAIGKPAVLRPRQSLILPPPSR